MPQNVWQHGREELLSKAGLLKFKEFVNLESELRSQVFALQKCNQAAYVPSSNSDLYKYSYNPNNAKQSQTHSLLFQKENFCDFNPNPDNKIVGSGMFYNSTRTQVKEIGDKV